MFSRRSPPASVTPEVAAVDRDLRAVVIEERCSFGAELRAELAEEYQRQQAKGKEEAESDLATVLAWLRRLTERGRWMLGGFRMRRALPGVQFLPLRRPGVGVAALTFVLVIGAVAVPPARATIFRFFGVAPAQPPAVPTSVAQVDAPRLIQRSELTSSTPEAHMPLVAPPAPLALANLNLLPATIPALLDRESVRRTVSGEYPPSLQRQGVGGTVVLKMWIRPDGATDAPRIAESSGVPALDSAALRASNSFRFLPATRSGQAVGTWADMAVRFRPSEADSQPAPEQRAVQIPMSN